MATPECDAAQIKHEEWIRGSLKIGFQPAPPICPSTNEVYASTIIKTFARGAIRNAPNQWYQDLIAGQAPGLQPVPPNGNPAVIRRDNLSGLVLQDEPGIVANVNQVGAVMGCRPNADQSPQECPSILPCKLTSFTFDLWQEIKYWKPPWQGDPFYRLRFHLTGTKSVREDTRRIQIDEQMPVGSTRLA